MNTTHDLVARYIAAWNEPQTTARRKQIEALWAADGVHFTPSMEARGHDAIERRVTVAWEKWVLGARHSFRACADADSHHGGIKFHWEMITPDGEVSSLGFDFLVLGTDGRIVADYQFLEPLAPR